MEFRVPIPFTNLLEREQNELTKINLKSRNILHKEYYMIFIHQSQEIIKFHQFSMFLFSFYLFNNNI